MNNPTTKSYTSLSFAYEYFNRELFGGELPPCLITMQRHKGSFGYFSGSRFLNTADSKDITDEIALNPTHFGTRPAAEVLSTLTHEMVHLWQHHFGTPSQRGYHNSEWAAKMLEIGLTPTNTGKPGGNQTGQQMAHFIMPDGRFAKAATRLLSEHPAILYHDRSQDTDPARRRKALSKTKYTCPVCSLNSWAKPDVLLICGTCKEELVPQA